MSKRNWFKTKRNRDSEKSGEKPERTSREEKLEGGNRDETDVETVMFVPSTPRGELVKLMRETDRNFRTGTTIKQIKFVERAGPSVRDVLVSSNPWGDLKCGRDGCLVCRGEKGGIGSCMKEGVLYSIKCMECKSKGRNRKRLL